MRVQGHKWRVIEGDRTALGTTKVKLVMLQSYDATTKCWAYSIEWKDSNPEDSKWHFGEKVKCIRGILINN